MKKIIRNIIRPGFNFLIKNVWGWGGASAITVGIVIVALIQSRTRPLVYRQNAHGHYAFQYYVTGHNRQGVRLFQGKKGLFPSVFQNHVLEGREETMENLLSHHYEIQGENPRQEIMARIAWRFITPEEADRFLDSVIHPKWLVENKNPKNLVDYLIRRHNEYVRAYNPARFTCLHAPDDFLRISSLPENLEPMGLTRLAHDLNAKIAYYPPLLVTEAKPLYYLVKLAESQVDEMRETSFSGKQSPEGLNSSLGLISCQNDFFLEIRHRPWRYDFLAYNSLDYKNVSPEEFQEAKIQLSNAFIRWCSLNEEREQILTECAEFMQERYLLARDGARSPSNETNRGRMKKVFILLAGLACYDREFRHGYINRRATLNVPVEDQLTVQDQRKFEDYVQTAVADRLLENHGPAVV